MKSDDFLTIQIGKPARAPRIFQVPAKWIRQIPIVFLVLIWVTMTSLLFGARTYFQNKKLNPDYLQNLEDENRQLKIALENQGKDVNTAYNPAPTTPGNSSDTSNNAQDPKASDQPTETSGSPLLEKSGVWSGLAEGIEAPQSEARITLENTKLEWSGKFIQVTGNVLYRNPGEGSQQGRLIVVARGPDRLFTHPDSAMNSGLGAGLLSPDGGEYYSVSRFRALRARLGPFEQPQQLRQIQVYFFDLSRKLILVKTFNAPGAP